MRWCIPNRLTRVLITVGYFILATLVTILTAFKPNTSKTEITLLSIFFPAQQVLFFAKMAIVKLLDPDVESKVNFGNLND